MEGVLLLVLPFRCLESKFIGGLKQFETLLTGFGFVHLVPVKLTPRLAFFVLGVNKSLSDVDAVRKEDDCDWAKIAKKSVEHFMVEETLLRFTDLAIEDAHPNQFGVLIPPEIIPRPS